MPPKKVCIQAIRAVNPNPSVEEAKPIRHFNLGSISDKELLFVFSRLPLSDLQSLELLSHRIHWIVKLVYANRRSLSLLQTPQYRDQLQEIARYRYFTDHPNRFAFGLDCYRVTREINPTGVGWLKERFPKVTQLTLYCVDHLSLERFVQLLQLYPTLERLVLFSTVGQQAEYFQNQFWTALNGLRGSLRSLVCPFGLQSPVHEDQLGQLDLLYRELFEPNQRPLYLTFNDERKLETLCMLYQTENNQQMWFMASQRAGAPNLEVDNAIRDIDRSVDRIGLYVPESAHGRSHDRKATIRMLGDLFADWNPTNLTHLDIAIPGSVDLLSILHELAPLTRLTHLRLTERKTGQPARSALFSKLNKTNYKSKLGQPNRTLMPSVRQLNLFQFVIIPSSGMFLFLSEILPQIRSLYFEDCHMANPTGKLTFPVWFLESIRHFGHLDEVFNNYRLVLQMDRVDQERDNLLQLIQTEMFDKARI